MAKKDEKKRDEFESVEQALTTTEAFIEKYQNPILYGVGIAVVVVLGFLAFYNFYSKPRELKAENEIYKAQLLFSVDSFQVALDGNIELMGFKEIASTYDLTSSGNVAKAYAGICYYKLDDYNNSIKYLSQYDGKDEYLSAVVIGLIGDAYVELGELPKAISHYEKVAGFKNEVVSPIYLKKAGVAYESLGELSKAEKSFIKIKELYPRSSEASDIDKYIARVQQ